LGAQVLGIPLKNLVARMNQFKNPLPMRMEVKRQKGFLIINDAYNANPHSFSQAFKVLENYPLKKIAVVGQMLELGPKSAYYHRQLARQIIAGKFEYCLMLGKLTLHLKDSLTKLGYRKALHFSSPQEVSRFISGKFSSKKELKKRYLIFLKGSRKMEFIISFTP
jgi:UDP-N-acetylmuramoyl-tripeptide--D-alanyl-D-alanine ligase